MMMHFRMIFFLLVMNGLNSSLIYNTNRGSKTDFDCFYANIIDNLNRDDGTFLRTNYLTPYCRRVTSNDVIDEIEGNVKNGITFETLRSQKIRSEELLQWSTSLDTIEQYAIYLTTNNTKFAQTIFYDCSSLWFGSHCQYTFNLSISIESFGDFVNASFNNRAQFSNKLVINTCYPHLSGCYRGPTPMCLDWREICNGIIDCIGDSFGIDEQYCEELEMNECEATEYRCHNGAQCIPLEFFQDGWTSKDCLDGTDEHDLVRSHPFIQDYIILNCISIPTFLCEERSCRYTKLFPCGDGDCHSSAFAIDYLYSSTTLCPGTNRDSYYLQTMSTNVTNLSNDCYKLLSRKLKLSLTFPDIKYDEADWLSENWLSSNNCSMNYIPFPADAIFAKYLQVIYTYDNIVKNMFNDASPDYLCNDPRHCLQLPKTTLQIGGLDCRPFEQVTKASDAGNLYYLYYALISTANHCSSMGNQNIYSSNSSLFYCESSHRYISKHRLLDGVRDCYDNEDEKYPDSCSLNDSQRYSCQQEEKCISPVALNVPPSDCIPKDDVDPDRFRSSDFALLCDRIGDGIRKDDETDETNCEWWPCNNSYSRCDGVFQCANGIDELDCPNFGCSTNELKCNNEYSTKYRCIPHAYIYEKPIDCNVYYGNETFCRSLFYFNNSMNDKNEYLPWKEKTCLTHNDICGSSSMTNQNLFCNSVDVWESYVCDRMILNIDDNEPVCTLKNKYILPRFVRFFSTLNLGYFPSVINTTLLSSDHYVDKKQNRILSLNTSLELIEYCNRGILIYEGKFYAKKCLCPPNYFGDQCQWQNQRISLTLQINKMSSVDKNNSMYDIFIYLIDNQHQIIYSYEKISYISSKDCQTKYNRYLLYPTKPKNVNYNYSIHIDMYDKITLNYSASWYLNIPFPFLPVNRLATRIRIPSNKSQPSINCSLTCGIHGKCFDYVNSNKSFCHCDPGYSGRFCNLTSECSCSSDSICLNSSICLCPINKFGSQCYLERPSCQPINPCKNNGLCIPIDDRINKYDFICLCPEDYMGINCEYKANRIDIHFKSDIIASAIFAHYIIGFNDKQHERITIFKKIPFNYQSISLFTSQSFHLLFIEFLNNSYLIVRREIFIPSEHISVNISTDQMCVNFTELFNSTILGYKTLRRMKYYQIPCLENATLKCFYDEIHMCICDENRFTNCFEYNHNMTYDCQGYNPCENNGKCFQDNVTCPQQLICMCEKCYYGRKCQLTTKGFSLSLDVIFGYHIKPSVAFSEQSKAVKITTSLTIIIFIFGFINGSLSILVFRRKTLKEFGCGIYLLINSILSLITITIFTTKYCQLLLSQMNIITNPSVLYYNCLLTDILLKILLSSGDWLNACVAIERAFIAIQGLKFDKSKSVFIAKCIIPILFLIIIISYIHDPISRQLFDDEDEQRIWCIVNYSSKLRIYDAFINLFHFLMPFIINFLSALIIIIQVFRARSKVQKKSSCQIFYLEIKRHKHILISSFILILLAFPRLLISFLSGCMESARDPWLFLTGYYISFVPPLLIVTIFVLPSKKYRKEFFDVIGRQSHMSQ